MEISGGNITLRETLVVIHFSLEIFCPQEIKNIFLDLMITIDGKFMLTFYEIFQKKFVGFNSSRRNLIEKAWMDLESELI